MACSSALGQQTALVATDGRRLAMLDIDLEFPRSQKPILSFRPKPSPVAALLTDEGDVRVSVGSGADRV
jgi:DNA polymerase-3 subunit beta